MNLIQVPEKNKKKTGKSLVRLKEKREDWNDKN